MSLILPQNSLSRRQLLQWSGFSGASLLLSGCGSSLFADQIGLAVEPLNETVQRLMLSQKPVPEFPMAVIDAEEKLLINSFDITPELDLTKFRLKLDGEVGQPMQLSLADIQKLPLTSMVMRHICVEGWAAIVHWGGVRMQELVRLAQPKPEAHYVYFQSADGYYESWDLASVVHPQTLMVYQRNGRPLSVDNGAPLRLASPVKLGYKQSKWVTQITFTSQLMPTRRGYWEDQGYEWFAGL